MPPRCQLLSGLLPAAPRISCSAAPALRTFASSAPLHKAKGGDLGSHLPKHIIPRNARIPPYPHGPNLLFKQSNKGLYGGQIVQFGNNVSPDTETKTRRYWKPNIMTKSLYSIALEKKIKIRVTSKVLRVIDREGGIDEYLLKESPARIKELGPTGWALRWALMQTPAVIARFRAEAAAIGLAQEVIDAQWPLLPESKETLPEGKQERWVQRAQEEEKKMMLAKARVRTAAPADSQVISTIAQQETVLA